MPSAVASLISTKHSMPNHSIVISFTLIYCTKNLYHTLYPARPVFEPIPIIQAQWILPHTEVLLVTY